MPKLPSPYFSYYAKSSNPPLWKSRKERRKSLEVKAFDVRALAIAKRECELLEFSQAHPGYNSSEIAKNLGFCQQWTMRTLRSLQADYLVWSKASPTGDRWYLVSVDKSTMAIAVTEESQ
jgi:hypothetical protein